ncbi:Uncharacterized conserved protein YybS, DUF2232 family [Bacillus sp. OV322]|nr:Uncharacterized conserved protein YybS, DUF2232 family [Bacillus sp. OV322]
MMNGSEGLNNGRKVAEGGVLLALYSILLLLVVQLPFLIFLFFFLPAPFILAAIKQKLSWSFGMLFMASLLATVLGMVSQIPMVLVTGLVGITIGYHIQHDKSPILMFIRTVLVFIAGFAIMAASAALFFHINFISLYKQFMKQALLQIDKSAGLLSSMGQTSAGQFKDQFIERAELIMTLLPSLIVTASIFMVLLFLWAAHPILKRFSPKKTAWPRFREIQLPKSILWYYLITMILLAVIHPDKGSTWYIVLMNLFSILQFFMTIQGLSLFFYISYIKKLPKAVPVILVIASFFIPIIQSAVRLLGIIDLGFPFREYIRKKN